jgi:uncharacterized alkaline shock family protein YloU
MTDIPSQGDASTASDADLTDDHADVEPAIVALAGASATLTTAHGPVDRTAGAIYGAADHPNGSVHQMAGRAGEIIAHAADEAGDRLSDVTHTAVTRIRNNATLAARRGTTTVANEVVEKITGIAARDVPGVYDLGGDTVRLLTSVREKLHLGDESKAQGVSVRLNGKQADLSITIVLEYGFVVSSVTDKVREKVISAVETLLDLDVTNVDILVDDVHIDEDGPVGDDASRATGYSSETTGITVGG